MSSGVRSARRALELPLDVARHALQQCTRRAVRDLGRFASPLALADALAERIVPGSSATIARQP